MFVVPTADKHLMLNNMLYMPYVTKNLLSVSPFSKDNQVYFEFHVSHCLIKDSISHHVLLCDLESGGLYRLDFSYFATVHSDPSQTAAISPDVFLSIADQSMVSCNNIALISSQITIITLNDNASVQVDDIHSGSFMNDSEFTCFLSSLKSNETSQCGICVSTIPLYTFLLIFFVFKIYLLNMFLLNVLPV